MLRSVSHCVRLGAVCLALISAPLASQESGEPPILTFHQSHPLLPAYGDTPMVRVYASGLVRFHRPRGLKNPGDFEVYLNPEELQAYLAMAGAAGDVDRVDTLVAHDDIDVGAGNGGRQELVYTSDATITRVQVPRASGDAALVLDDGTAASARAGALKTIEVPDLTNVDAQSRGPAMQSLQDLQASMLELFSQAGKGQ